MSDFRYSRCKAAARANRAFYRAFEARDLAAMRALWLDDPDIKCIHPGGEILVGTEPVMASWQHIFDHTEAIHFDLCDLTIEVTGELAWASHIEKVRSTGIDGTFTAEAAATNLFVSRNGGWKMILHHASPIARRFKRG